MGGGGGEVGKRGGRKQISATGPPETEALSFFAIIHEYHAHLLSFHLFFRAQTAEMEEMEERRYVEFSHLKS